MIDNVFFQKLGLSDDQTILLKEALQKESRFRKILLQEGVSPKCVESVVTATKFEDVDFSNESLLREKVKVEWADFIK